jgi:hypothetical protein
LDQISGIRERSNKPKVTAKIQFPFDKTDLGARRGRGKGS